MKRSRSLARLVACAAGCAAGNPRFTADEPAGFWMGLWHGAIGVVTLVIGIFDDPSDLPFAAEIYVDEKPDFYAFEGERKCMTGAEFEAKFR